MTLSLARIAAPLAAILLAAAPATRLSAQAVTSTPAEIAQARADSARYPYTDADVHFMSAMIGHHAQAIDMSRMVPTHAASAEVQRLAERIINAQQDEIRTMQRWLSDRRKPVPEAKAGPMKMMMGGMVHEMLMPGMLTKAQMDSLDASRGAEFDRRFLISMIRHHQGAVSMVTDLFGSYGAAQDQTVFKFASDVGVDQTTEIARMQRMLAVMIFGTGNNN